MKQRMVIGSIGAVIAALTLDRRAERAPPSSADRRRPAPLR